MEVLLKYLVFMISLFFLIMILFLAYLRGKRRGIKKSLYRITYISFCVLIAFILAPYVTEFILNMDLYKSGHAIEYQGMYFYRLIDFIEEVIVHSAILNDIYSFAPSLKNLLMDFPQTLFIPFVYVLVFLLSLCLLLPLYMYLSYKRKRRVLYVKSFYNKKQKVWAGVLSSVQTIFIISIVLTPVNGVIRIYSDSSKGIIKEDSNICNEIIYLDKYEAACLGIEGYNASVFSMIGKNPLNNYIYNSLSRIDYNNSSTSLNKEVVSIARAGLILNKTGLLNAIEVSNFDDVTKLNFNELSEEDIDVLVAAFEQSLYTQDVLYDVYEWAKAYLDLLIKVNVDDKFHSNYVYEDLVGELKIILRTINLIINTPGYLQAITKVYDVIYPFSLLSMKEQSVPETAMKFTFDLIYSIDVDAFYNIYVSLRNSKIYNDIIPQMLELLASRIGVRLSLSDDPRELDNLVFDAINATKIFQNHRYVTNNYSITLLHLFNDLTMDEVHYIAKVAEKISKNETMKYFFYDIANYGIASLRLKIRIPTEVLFEIKDYERELELAHLVIQIVYEYIRYGNINFDKALYAYETYKDTVLFKTAWDFAIELLPDAFLMWITGKDYKYVVGEYV